jgi:glyoxylase-like metal-dependent hydrolase (beta-lactamase superfamily II)
LELLPGIHQIEGVNANSYLLVEDKLTLIDTGMPHNIEKISNYISNKLSRPLSDLETIVLTHCHIDHVGNAYELKKLTDAKVAVHRDDADIVAGKKTLDSPKGAISVLLKAVSPFFKVTPVQPDIILEDNNVISKLTAIHTPGHTPGSIALYDKERKVILVGDTIRFIKGKIEGPPKQFIWDKNKTQQSIEKISHLDFDLMLSGHGEPLQPNASRKLRAVYGSLD